MFRDKLYLASKSRRRRELIQEIFSNLGYLNVSEGEPEPTRHQSALDYLMLCIKFKWEAALSAMEQSAVSQAAPKSRENLSQAEIKAGPFGLLVADTTVVLGKKILSKPSSSKEAQQMLGALSGKKHFVYTACLLGRFQSRADTVPAIWHKIIETEVEFHKLTKRVIASYVRSGDPMDKAGAYGFQGQALRFVKSIRGSYLNIMGLPLSAISQGAAEVGFR